jgi:hypothetical protein
VARRAENDLAEEYITPGWRTEMAKEYKKRAELKELVLDEARKSGKCAGLTEVVITGPFPSREFSWDVLKRPRAATISDECFAEIEKAVRRLQLTFELSGD